MLGGCPALCHRYAVLRNGDMGGAVPWAGAHGYGCASPTGLRKAECDYIIPEDVKAGYLCAEQVCAEQVCAAQVCAAQVFQALLCARCRGDPVARTSPLPTHEACADGEFRR